MCKKLLAKYKYRSREEICKHTKANDKQIETRASLSTETLVTISPTTCQGEGLVKKLSLIT